MNAAAITIYGIYFPSKYITTNSKSLKLLPMEITDKAPLKSCSVHPPVWSIRCEGNRRGRPRGDTASGGTDKGNSSRSSDDKSANSTNQEEILALFRRIQASIAKDGGSGIIKKRRSERSVRDGERKSAELVLDVLRKSKKQIKENKELSQNNDVPETKSQRNVSPMPDLKLTRPPTKFVKKSPIPKTSIAKERAEVVSEESEATAAEHNIEEMKLTELKQLAKSRGMKGYSKLKKIELVELLKGL